MLRICGKLLILVGILGLFGASAVPPSVSYNVHVMQNATPQQCNGSWDSRTSPEQVDSYSAGGERSGLSSPGVQSCTGCAVDPSSKDCVCSTCYSYFDDF